MIVANRVKVVSNLNKASYGLNAIVSSIIVTNKKLTTSIIARRRR